MKPLTKRVEFDCPFRVHEDGKVTDEHSVYAPDVHNVVEIADFHSTQWELVNGFSGQDRYAGPIMHSSEYLGGYMEQWVMENPGVYVITAAYYDNECEECDHSPELHDEDGCGISSCDCKAFKTNEAEPTTIEGWVLCRLLEENSQCGPISA